MSKWEEYQKKIEKERQVKPWDLLDPANYVEDSEISDSRLAICKSCPELIKLTTQCRKCGCFMAAKTKLQKAVCPIGKW